MDRNGYEAQQTSKETTDSKVHGCAQSLVLRTYIMHDNVTKTKTINK